MSLYNLSVLFAINHVRFSASETRTSRDFGKSYGLLMEDGPLAGLLARSVIVLDEKDHVLYTELVPEITEEPNYHKAFEVLHAK